jgi:hypothetical protein
MDRDIRLKSESRRNAENRVHAGRLQGNKTFQRVSADASLATLSA